MHESYEPASLIRRFLSYCIDILIQVLLFTPVWIWYLQGLFSDRSGIFLLGYSTLVVYGFAIFRFIYLSALWRLGGTAGERLLHITVIRNDGLKLSGARCLVRALTIPLNVLSLALVYIPSPHRGLQDRISGSDVARI